MGIFSKPKGNRKLYEQRRKKFVHHAHDGQFNWDWSSIPHNRIAIVNRLLAAVGKPDPDYLEIGCATNTLFHSVGCKSKTGVDPEKGGTHRMTSDEFFAQNDKSFDVIFIDGLHEYAQVHKDAVNALDCLNEGGWIAFHDLLPRNWKEHHVPILNSLWTGDCWKAAFELTRSPDLDFKIALADHGVGIARKTKKGACEILDQSELLSDQQFAYFHDNIDELPVTEMDAVYDWINKHSG